MAAGLAIRRYRARLPAQAEPVAARLALQTLAAELEDVLPRGLPPQSLLWVRRVAVQVPPGALRRPGAARGEGLDTGRRQLDAALSRAARPALGPVPADAEAVLFADEAEMLACLALAAEAGQLDRWWWRGLLGARWPQWQPAWAARPWAQAGARALLARAGQGGVVRRLGGPTQVESVGTAGLTANEGGRGTATPSAATTGTVPARQNAEVCPVPVEPTDERLCDGGAPVAADRLPTATRRATSAVHPGRSDLKPAAPEVASATPAEQAGAAPAGDLAVGLPPAVPGTRPVAPTSSASHAPRELPAGSPPPLAASSPARATPSARGTPQGVPAAAPSLTRGDGAESLLPVEAPAIAKPGDAAPPVPAAQTPRNAPPAVPAVHAAVPDEVPDAAVEPPTWPWPQALHSHQGALMFLVNALQEDGLYPDFTRPLDAGLPVPLWALLGALAAHWRLPDDPLHALLADRSAGWHAGLLPGDLSAAPGVARGPWARWLPAYARSLRRRLCRRLGLAPRDLAAALHRGPPCRLWVSSSDWAVEFDLAHHDVAWRLAGLDRDPGWLPSVDCTLRFTFT